MLTRISAGVGDTLVSLFFTLSTVKLLIFLTLVNYKITNFSLYLYIVLHNIHYSKEVSVKEMVSHMLNLPLDKC